MIPLILQDTLCQNTASMEATTWKTFVNVRIILKWMFKK